MSASARDAWQPTASDRARRRRAEAYRAIRAFFAAREVLEVETPLLSRAANTDPQIDSFEVRDPSGPWFLRTSPEFPLKRLLAHAEEPVYELGRVFRRGELGRWHNPEFTMLEWYRPGFDDRRLAMETVELVNAVRDALQQPVLPARTASCATLLAEAGGDGALADGSLLRAFLAANGWARDDLARRDALELAISLAAAHAAADGQLLVVLDFPAELAALARVTDGVARRFELFADGLELANGYHELRDPLELADRMDRELARRASLGRPAVPRDERLLAAHRAGLPECAGVALGVDRLLAWIDGAGSLADVISFPGDRA